ncbi:hypothetical protein EAE96_010307 [Botrytis aclada]|nr:hypothetical protein EAE96_010307 [Botrytis aclada]
MNIEKEHLLGDSEANISNHPLSHDSRRTFLKNGFLLHVLLVIIYTSLSIFYVWVYGSSQKTSLYPIKGLDIRYDAKPYTDYITSQFAGPPSPEVDAAWHELLSNVSIRVTGSELEASNQSSVELPEGGGYMAWLGVYHELHCIKMLRQWNYREYYHPNVTEKERPHYDIHADHCLDVLRSAALCHGDTTLTTFGWADQEQPMLNTKLVPHKCVNWEVLESSIKSRVVTREEIHNLVNPKLHPVE